MEYAIGVDLGGTKMAVCIVSDKGQVIDGKRMLTEADQGQKKVLANLNESIQHLLDAHKDLHIKGIGVGIPGFADSSGKIVFMPNVPLTGFHIGKYLDKRFDMLVQVENDANCFAMGEYFFGGHKSKVLLGLIVGTGIGAGIVSNGKILSGSKGGAGEIGHILIDNTAKKLAVGKNDFESVCSGPNITRRYAAASGKEIFPKEVFLSKDPLARKVIDEEYESLGKLLGMTVNILNPDTIILGGGVSKSLEPKRLKKEVEKYSIPFSATCVEVKRTKLDELAGVLGAAALIFQR